MPPSSPPQGLASCQWAVAGHSKSNTDFAFAWASCGKCFALSAQSVGVASPGWANDSRLSRFGKNFDSLARFERNSNKSGFYYQAEAETDSPKICEIKATTTMTMSIGFTWRSESCFSADLTLKIPAALTSWVENLDSGSRLGDLIFEGDFHSLPDLRWLTPSEASQCSSSVLESAAKAMYWVWPC